MADTDNKNILLTVKVVDNFVAAKQNAEKAKKKYEELEKTLSILSKEYENLSEGQKQYSERGQELVANISDTKKELAKQAEVMTRSSGEFKNAEKALQSTVDAENILNGATAEANKSLGEMQQQLVTLSNVSFDGLSPEQVEAVKQAIADTSFEIQQLQQDLKNREPGQFFVNATESAQALGASMQVLTGIFGENNEVLNSLNNVVLKFISFTQAAGVISEYFTKQKYKNIAASVKQIASTLKLSGATKAHTTQEVGATVATGGWTAAQKLLNIAMKASPIFLIIGAIELLTGGISKLVSWLFGKSDAVKAAEKALENYTAVSEASAKKVEQANDKEKSAVDKLNFAHRQKILQMKKNGKTAEEIAAEEVRHQQRVATEAEKASKARSDAANAELTALKTVIETQRALAEDGDEDAQEKLKEMVARQRELNNALVEESNLRQDIALKQQEAAQARQEQADADKKNASKKYMNNALKEIEEQKKLRQEMLKAEEGYLLSDFKTKQEYERRMFDMEESAAREALDLKKKFGEISQKEYTRQSDILALQRTQFENEQLKEQEAYADSLLKEQRKHQKQMAKILGEELKAQRMDVTDEYENTINDIKAMMKMLPKDSPEYKALADDIVKVEKQMHKDLQAIDDKERAVNLQTKLSALDKEYEKELEKLANNKLAQLELERKHLEEVKKLKLAANPNADTNDEDAALKANDEAAKLAAIQASAAEQLAVENLTAKKRYQIKRDALQKEFDLLKVGSEEQKAKQQEILDLDKAFQEERFECVMEYAEKAKEVMSGIFELGNAQDEAKLQRATEQNEQEKQQLQAQLDANLISKDEYNKKVKQSDDKLAKEQAKIKRKQAIQDKASAIFDVGIKTATAIMSALNTQPFLPMGPIMAAVAGAMGAVQLAAVMAKPIPKAARGMYIKGASHASGGVQLEAEGGEMVINKRSASMFAPLLSAINEAGGGVPFVSSYSDGGFAMRDYQRTSTQGVTSEAIASAVKEAVQEVKIYTAIEDINEGNKKYAAVTDSSKF